MLNPFDWNLVVLGRWNPALFTPASVAARIFGIEEGTPVEVMLSIDDIAPPKISHDNITIIGTAAKMEMLLRVQSFELMQRAMGFASRQVADLSKTPLKAVGLNFRYKGELPLSVLETFSSTLDARFGDADLELTGRGYQRIAKFQTGQMSVDVARPPEGDASISFNFERRSVKPEDHIEWLGIAAVDFRKEIERVMEKVFELEAGEDYAIEQSANNDTAIV